MDYDTKLGEWFKEVERRAEQLRARKKAEPEPDHRESVVDRELLRSPLYSDLPPPVVREPEPREQVAQAAPISTAVDVAEPEPLAAEKPDSLFEVTDAAPVEDFLSFLNRSDERRGEPAKVEEPEDLSDQGILGLTEGTGEPRPILPQEEREEPAATQAADLTPPVPAKPSPPPTVAQPLKAAEPAEMTEWARFPEQLRHLLDSAQEEVAQHSYKSFKETRAGLIHRLLDPPISLEEAARILNVCPTTVRRYTNRGVLKHFRTPGNQRRFRLSDVLSFLETQMGKSGSARVEGSSPRR